MKRSNAPVRPDRTKELNDLMKEHELTAEVVAAMLSVRLNTVQIWTCKSEISIPAAKLELLKMKVAAKVA